MEDNAQVIQVDIGNTTLEDANTENDQLNSPVAT